MKRIIIIGSRQRDAIPDYRLVQIAFLEIYEKGDMIVSGGCPKGGDRFAEMIAKLFAVPITIYFPDWRRLGRSAGFIRNTTIAQNGDIMIACVAADRAGGTEDTIKKFKKFKPDGEVILC